MATFTKKVLSGSTNGKQIKVVHTTNGTADTIHTAVAGTGSLDEIWLYAFNGNSVAVVLTLLFGGISEPDNEIVATLSPLAGRVLLCDGMLLQNGLIVKAYCSVANVVEIDGFVNNIA